MRMQIGIREAKTHLSKYVKLVKDGKEVILTERGKPVGKIVPIARRELSLENRVRMLEDAGMLEPEKQAIKIPPPIPVSGYNVQQILQDDRERQ